MRSTANESASELLEVVPIVMREIRSEMRSRRSPDLTVPQFRALVFVNRNRGSSLLEVAIHMGLTPPSVCRLVDVLIARGFMTREEHPTDRRRVRLAVTSRGAAVLESCRKGTLAHLSGKLSCLAADELEVILRGMRTLRTVFATDTRTRALVK